ncbi:MAG: tetraacyldisaccharide 4'-kinase [Candidatus Kapabacteria bacterium]|nr:tetraacyldisaccharide 4'-kinase [Candidatus Kapabacteria bacterium]
MLSVLSKLYGRLVERRNTQYDHRQRPIVPVECPVISVGNLSAGGTGKTPTVQMLVRMLRQAGRRPAIVMRGYRRRSRGLVVVHDGVHMLATVDAAGDEAALHATVLGVPVVVSADKVEAAAYAAGNLPCDVIIVDDGFQHRALHRDVDVVIVDAATIGGSLLPAGRLREPLSSLKRADIVLLGTGVTTADVQPHVKSTACIYELTTTTSCPAPLNRPVVAVSGIARPERFHSALYDLGYTVAESIVYGDHHRYTAFNVRTITAAATRHNASVITTAKDQVKLLPLVADEEIRHHISVLELEMHVSSSTSLLSALLSGITS